MCLDGLPTAQTRCDFFMCRVSDISKSNSGLSEEAFLLSDEKKRDAEADARGKCSMEMWGMGE